MGISRPFVRLEVCKSGIPLYVNLYTWNINKCFPPYKRFSYTWTIYTKNLVLFPVSSCQILTLSTEFRKTKNMQLSFVSYPLADTIFKLHNTYRKQL